ncbi:MAG: galactokinase [Planctomycetes bacterium]|nr:galactokinase [Planctomycetota bacterium]
MNASRPTLETDGPPAEQIQSVVAAFTKHFGRQPNFGAAAPGRVNIIGEHTDYNDGFVLPMAIDRWTVVVGDHALADRSTFLAVDLKETAHCDLRGELSPIEGNFANYLMGVADQFNKRAIKVPNLDIAITTSVSIGAGLASSAAMEVAMATLLEVLLKKSFDPVEKAKLCQKAEHEFVGTPCGIMDMLIAIKAKSDHALLIDCQTNATEPIPLPLDKDVSILIADTHVRHDLAQSEYVNRRQTCEDAARKLGYETLRQVESDYEPAVNKITTTGQALTEEEVLCATHVLNENKRVQSAANALRKGEMETVGQLMFDSHTSLKELFKVSCEELDVIVDTAAKLRADSGVLGARMTGGGFGGCAIILCNTQSVDKISVDLLEAFVEQFDYLPTLFTTPAVGGARSIGV